MHFSGSSRVVDAYRSPLVGVTGTPVRMWDLARRYPMSRLLQLYIKIVYFFINVTNKYTWEFCMNIHLCLRVFVMTLMVFVYFNCFSKGGGSYLQWIATLHWSIARIMPCPCDLLKYPVYTDPICLPVELYRYSNETWATCYSIYFVWGGGHPEYRRKFKKVLLFT